MMRVFRLLAVMLLVGLTSGCDSFLGLGAADGIDAQGALSATVKGLHVHLFAPDMVARGDTFEVRFAAENRTDDAIAVTTPSGCFMTPCIFNKEGARVPFKGSLI